MYSKTYSEPYQHGFIRVFNHITACLNGIRVHYATQYMSVNNQLLATLRIPKSMFTLPYSLHCKYVGLTHRGSVQK